MEIQIIKVDTQSKLRTFIHLPEKIHRGHKNWVPPLYMDEWTFFNPDKNRHFSHCDTILILAMKNGEAVGRCMGIVHRAYNQLHNEKSVRFSFIETYNDQEVFHALIGYIADWGRQLGMEKIVGPLAFSDKDPQGFMTEGFEEPIAIATNCNFPYLVELTENEGFVKLTDLVVYKIDIPD